MFRDDFIWGVASAAYQIEGACNKDGRGESVWDTFCREEGTVLNGHNGDIACDHYHRYKEDVQIIKDLGVKAYRFSLSWTRILPKGVGEVNQAGIDFYNRLINELIENDITPYVTLFHWDYPQALYNKGGWLNPDSPRWFAEYTEVVAKSFGDRVKNFFTFNEPQCFIGLGYCTGAHAPGVKLPVRDTVRMSHHVLVAHGLADKILRDNVPNAKVSFVQTSSFAYPHDEKNELDIEAARKLSFSSDGCASGEYWAWNTAWWNDPILLGDYPADGLEMYGQYLPDTWREDLKIIHSGADYVCHNLYNGYEVRALANGGYEKVERFAGYPRTACNWPITPEAIKWGVKLLHERYKLPVIIAENGLSCADVIALDGKVHDPNRIDFLSRYILAMSEAADEGADAAGYFHWSIMDNFEWAQGYRERFGLVYIDYPSQKRIKKDSWYWYKNIVER